MGLLNHGELIHVSFGQGTGLLFLLEHLQLHAQPCLDPDQELHAEEVIPHPYIDIALDDRMSGVAQYGGQRRQGKVRRRGHPFRWKQEHDLGLLPILLLDRNQAVDLYKFAHSR